MRNRIISFLFPLLAACSVSTEGGSPTGDDRGSLGKADLVGSCEHKNKDLCGGKGTGNCWCDDACVEFGDCCSDADDVCGIEPPPPAGDVCGGFAGLACDEGEFCFYTEDQGCGFADQTGECLDVPEICTKEFMPVCGCDGQTYSNPCHAHGAGTSVASKGACDEPPQFCGGFAGIQCPEGLACIDDPNDDCDPNNGGADCGGICVEPKQCEPVFCALFCENGFATDENGCEICSCKEEPTCCDPAENPGGIEGAHCCADGNWRGDIGNGGPDECDPFGGVGQVCGEPVDTCGPILNDFETELAEIRACVSDDQCGQVLAGTSCGCTRNLVARNDADLADLEEIRAKAEANECSTGLISTCDCPAVDGFLCDAGVCTWNYL